VSLLVPWLVFPAVLGLLCAGCGIVASRLAGYQPGPCVLLPLGFAVLVVVSGFAVWVPGTAGLAAPAVVGLAVIGGALWVTERPRLDRGWLWPLGAALLVFLAYGAPILASGAPTFAGYISLDDASTLFAMTDRALEHGRTIDGLPPSSYEATLATSLMVGYPLGTLLPLGIGADLVGQDPAWVYQPYLAFLAALLALGLYGLAGRFLSRPILRAGVAVVAAQPALLYAYGLWDGNKELAAAALLALFAPLSVECVRTGGRWFAAALAGGALLTSLGLGGAIWLLPAASLAAVLAVRARTWRGLLLAASTTVVLALPAFGAATTWLDADNVASWRSGDRLANLLQPLSPAQVAGIWPSGDFRLRPDDLPATVVLIALVAALALGGALTWIRARAWALLALGASSAGGTLVFWALGSPWIEAKAFATVSPFVLLAAAAGAGWLLADGRRVEAAIAAVAVAGGVIWSNALAYREAWLAPREQLAELEAIGGRFAGQGPALMTEYQPYGVRHLLRTLDAEGASELRRRPVRLRNGSTLPKGGYANIDDFALGDLLVYRTLVLRRSPIESRPPSVYRLRRRGRWYEVWQRAAVPPPIARHVPFGDASSPVAMPACSKVRRLADDGRSLADVEREGVFVTAVPDSVAVRVRLPRRAEYAIWLEGSIRGRVDALVDGRRVGGARHHLDNDGQWIELGRALLGPGTYRVSLRFHRDPLRPGSGGGDRGTHAVAVAPALPSRRVTRRPAGEADRLCGRPLDWLEVIAR
jgi:hypothetical protein